MTLPSDIARCPGIGSEEDGWREGCDSCLRRLSPPGERSPWIEPPPVVAFWCDGHLWE